MPERSAEQGDVERFQMKCRCNPLNPHQEDCPLNPSFAPVTEQGDVEAIRENVGRERDEQISGRVAAHLLRSEARAEKAEQELAKVRFCPYCATGFIPNPGDEHKDSCPGCARAEKAEQERDERGLAAEGHSYEVELLRARVEKAERALAEIRENALSWHGPLTDTGHERALVVIARWADAVLRPSPNSTRTPQNATDVEQGNVQPWREAEILIRESLLDGTVGGDLSEVRYNRAIMALTALTTQIEERDKRIGDLEEARSRLENLAAKREGRAFAAERALAAMRKALGAYRSALRSGEPESDQLRAFGEAALRSEDTGDES